MIQIEPKLLKLNHIKNPSKVKKLGDSVLSGPDVSL